MRQLILIVASCLISAAASAQSQPGAAATASVDVAAAVDARTVDHPPVSKARRAVANFTSLLREAALQAQASQAQPASTGPGEQALPALQSGAGPQDGEQAPLPSRPRSVATSPS